MKSSKNNGHREIGKLYISASFVVILFLTSFDAAAVDGIVPLIQSNFNINDSHTAIIRTSASIANTATLALTWLFGDVFERRKLFLSSVSFWIICSLVSVLLGSESFLIFVSFRSLASAAASVYGVLIPVMMADLFEDRALGIALMCVTATDFFSSSVTGIVSSWIVSSGIPWQSGVLAGPVLALLPSLGLLCTVSKLRSATNTEARRSVKRSFMNAFGIFSIKSYVLLTIGFSFGMFNVRSIMFWYPTMILNAWTAFPDTFLGLSYTTVITLNSLSQMAGTLIGLPVCLWFAQSWRHGTGLFSGRAPCFRAYPIVVGVGSSITAVSLILGLLVLADNYVLYAVLSLVGAISAAAETSLSQQMSIMVVPSNSRAASVALSRLFVGTITIPAAQFVGVISDALRGDFTAAEDKFSAYQKALLCSFVFAIASSICESAVIIFFPRDCENAAEKDSQDEAIDETSSLVGQSKIRSESLLEAVVRSRTVTMNSYY